jgi:hypothetical protein
MRDLTFRNIGRESYLNLLLISPNHKQLPIPMNHPAGKQLFGRVQVQQTAPEVRIREMASAIGLGGQAGCELEMVRRKLHF